eukprot:TRINITY_DN1242_c0_g3_i1.p1 TRINITY_DN1242_c0_g3~~TRINITY_DN1242_c0_g3_i1.p1  ORF type:complete len:177 (+),score=14.99 TRINITY_DN1242_c0_g3_i1:1177-1707(+)
MPLEVIGPVGGRVLWGLEGDFDSSGVPGDLPGVHSGASSSTSALSSHLKHQTHTVFPDFFRTQLTPSAISDFQATAPREAPAFSHLSKLAQNHLRIVSVTCLLPHRIYFQCCRVHCNLYCHREGLLPGTHYFAYFFIPPPGTSSVTQKCFLLFCDQNYLETREIGAGIDFLGILRG